MHVMNSGIVRPYRYYMTDGVYVYNLWLYYLYDIVRSYIRVASKFRAEGLTVKRGGAYNK